MSAEKGGASFEEDFMEGFAPATDPLAGGPLAAAEEKSREIIMEYNRGTFADIVRTNKDRPVRVLGVNVVEGAASYRETFLRRQLDPLLAQGETKLEDFLANIDVATQNMFKTNTVKNVMCHLDMPAYRMTNASPDTLELVANLHLDPIKKFFMKVGTNVGNGEGDGYITFQWKNIFGGGELVNLDTTLASNEIGKSNRSQYLLSMSTPMWNSPHYKFDVVGYHSSKLVDYTTFHEQLVRGLTLKVGTTHLQSEGRFNHQVSIENLVRSIHIATPAQSYRNNSIVNDYFLLNAGAQFKSSVTHTATFDSRDSLTLPRAGHFLKHSLELGIAPQAQFVKSTLEMAKAVDLDPVVVNLSWRSGFVRALSGAVHPMDRFQLGGANDVRGFLISGLGPKDMGLPIGGDVFYSFNASLLSRLPFVPADSGFRGHLFATGGKLSTFKQGESARDFAVRMREFSFAAGAGIVYAHPMARFELNWVVPLAITAGDNYKHGLQWGIGISFM